MSAMHLGFNAGPGTSLAGTHLWISHGARPVPATAAISCCARRRGWDLRLFVPVLQTQVPLPQERHNVGHAASRECAHSAARRARMEASTAFTSPECHTSALPYSIPYC